MPVVDTEIPNQVTTILSELRDYNKDKRRTAVVKLGMVGGDQAVRALIGVVGNRQEDLIVRGRAALMLGKLKDDRAVAALIDALEAPGFQTPYHAAIALGKIGDPRAVEALVNLAGNSRDKTRDAALGAPPPVGPLAGGRYPGRYPAPQLIDSRTIDLHATMGRTAEIGLGLV